MKKFMNNKYFKNDYSFGVIAAFILNFLIEAFSRHSLIEALKHLAESPFVFIYNCLLILMTLSFALLVRRKIALASLISLIWLAGGITNGIVLNNRVTPFTANELKLITSVIDIFPKYFNIFQIVLLSGAIILAIVIMIVIFFKAPKTKEKINYLKNGSLVAGMVISFSLITRGAISINLVETTFGNIAFAYLDYGFPYAFANSLMNTGIRRPINYSQDLILTLREQIDATNEAIDFDQSTPVADAGNRPQQPSQQHPNIVMVQLESFFDPTYMVDLQFSEDPVPNFRQLKEEFTSGFLRVPVIGAGTANTEFEVLTGMSLQFFGAGEYPYKTILRQTTAESINYNLAELGYSAHAIHNNRGTFYTRQRVFRSLGFNTFTPIEYMNVEETTPTGWAKDKYLIDPILDALNATDESDFIYAISVQGHGDYPSTPIEGHSKIKVSGWEDAGRLTSFEYFTNEIYDMDLFIGELISHLSLFSEDTVLVLFGDHLPTLGIKDEELENGDIFQTEYVIWSNFELPKDDVDLYAYQLGAHVLNQVGIHNGTLTSYHQNFKDTPDYLNNLRILQYDMLYGNQYIYDGDNPFERTELQLGVKPILITDIENDDQGDLYIKGENFTDYSRVKINSSTYDTTFINPNTLLVENYTPKENDVFSIQQVTTTNFVLSTSESFRIGQEEENNHFFEEGFREGFEAGYQEALKAIEEALSE